MTFPLYFILACFIAFFGAFLGATAVIVFIDRVLTALIRRKL